MAVTMYIFPIRIHGTRYTNYFKSLKHLEFKSKEHSIRHTLQSALITKCIFIVLSPPRLPTSPKIHTHMHTHNTTLVSSRQQPLCRSCTSSANSTLQSQSWSSLHFCFSTWHNWPI